MARRTATFHDWGKTHKQFSYALLGAGREISNDVKNDLTYLAEEFLSELDSEWPHSTKLKNGAKFGGDHDHPWYSGHLHDSVAVRIADRNKTVAVRYMTPSPDTGKPQHMSPSYDRIIGTEWGHLVAEGKAPYYFLPGIQVQFIIGVPYTNKVNESQRHSMFFEALTERLINKVDDWIQMGGLTRRQYIADGKMRTHKRVR